MLSVLWAEVMKGTVDAGGLAGVGPSLPEVADGVALAVEHQLGHEHPVGHPGEEPGLPAALDQIGQVMAIATVRGTPARSMLRTADRRARPSPVLTVGDGSLPQPPRLPAGSG